MKTDEFIDTANYANTFHYIIHIVSRLLFINNDGL